LETSSEDDFFHQAAVEELCRGLLQWQNLEWKL
jgi:hypothetical protein